MEDSAKKASRRSFLRRISLVAAAGPLLASCRPEASGELGAATANIARGENDAFSCTDVSDLTEEQVQTRKSLQYVDESPHADKRCNNCQLFTPPGENEQCGTCEVVPGPIHPKGHCTAWVAAAG